MGLDSHMADVGIDVGKSRLAWGWPSWAMASSIDFGKDKGLERYAELRMLQRWLVTYLPVGARLWIDQPFAGNGGIAAAQRLSETVGAVLTAQDWTTSPVIVHQATWKAQVIGNHMAGKEEIQAWLAENHPELAARCNTEDEYDAMVIGLYGNGRTSGAILPPTPRRPKRRSKKP